MRVVERICYNINMLDIKFVRENADVVRESQIARGMPTEDVDLLLKLDAQRISARAAFDALRAEQGRAGKAVASAKDATQKQELLAGMKKLASDVDALKEQADQAADAFETQMFKLQNVIEGAPSGGEDDFVVLKEVGEPATEKELGFKPRPHYELGQALDIIDTERCAKVAGSRFYFLKGLGARLDLALVQMGLDLALKNGFTPMITPTLVRPEVMRGTGFLGLHDAEVYRLGGDDEAYLVGTSEVALAGYHQDEIVEFAEESGQKQPLAYSGFSACYRREAGAAGKDTRGIIRVHQFHKL